jgi:YVTN family beta-propeller protein
MTGALARQRSVVARVSVRVFVLGLVLGLALCGCHDGKTPADQAPTPPAAGAAELFTASDEPAEKFLSPVALAAAPDGRTLYIAEHTAKKVAAFDLTTGKVSKSVALPERPAALLLSADGAKLYVAGAAPAGRVHVIATGSLKILESLAAGHTPSALALSPDGHTLYVCNRFTHDVSVLALDTGKETARVRVVREPVAAAVTPDGRCLVVGNHLPGGAADSGSIYAAVSIVDTASNQVAATVPLPNGSTGVRDLCLSPDGRYAYVTHTLGRYHQATTNIERGWMNTNALSIVSVADGQLANTVLLDSIVLGAANPWGVACSADGKQLCVTHAGTHELSVVDLEALHAKLARSGNDHHISIATVSTNTVPNDLTFLTDIRRKLPLPGNGPRGVVVVGTKAYAAEYFSDSLAVVDLAPSDAPEIRSLPLGPKVKPPPARVGEMLFNDASRCFQKWQSCATCHPDGRADGLNWDLLNDGMGNPKNTKSLLLAPHTPPMMSMGVREKPEDAVRSGFRFIEFAEVPEECSAAVDEYLKVMRPVPSPYLVQGRLSAKARRGAAVFKTAGCAHCHPPPLFTDLHAYDLGMGAVADYGKPFDVPTLREVWRTAPYLYDGRATTIREVLTKFNPEDRHGQTSDLSAEDVEALIEFVLSL